MVAPPTRGSGVLWLSQVATVMANISSVLHVSHSKSYYLCSLTLSIYRTPETSSHEENI